MTWSWQSGQKPVKLFQEITWKVRRRQQRNWPQNQLTVHLWRGGWALKKAKKSIRFSPRVQSFLQEIFLQVEETGNKANPSDVSAKMKRIRSTDGDKLFSMKEWLSAVQMTWYFSRLSPHNKNGLLNRDVSAYHEDEDDFQYVNEVEAMNTRFQIRRELEI